MFYMRIAKCGYEYEQYHAFFPLLPAAVAAVRSLGAPLRALPSHALPAAQLCHNLSCRAGGNPFLLDTCACAVSYPPGLQPWLDGDALLAVSGLLVSNIAFIISALYLDRCDTDRGAAQSG